MHRLPLLFSLMIVFLSSVSFMTPADQLPDDDTVAMVRANYLYQFSNYNNWPSEAKKGKFYVGIIGNPNVYESMAEKYGTKPIGSQTMDVISLNDVPENQSLHILFIDKSRKSELPKAVKMLKDKSTLVVTNWEGALSQGAHINFKNIDGVIRYEMDKKAMEDHKITPGTKIIQWAI